MWPNGSRIQPNALLDITMIIGASDIDRSRSVSEWSADECGLQRTGRRQHPLQPLSHLGQCRRLNDVAIHILHGTLQHIELVSQLFEFTAGHDEVGFIQTVTGSPGPRFELALTAAAFAEHPWATHARLVYRSSTPPAGDRLLGLPAPAVHG